MFESNMREGVGTAISTIVRWGSFHVGSVCVIGEEFGKIKQVLCDGKNVKRAVAGDTVQITGINRNVNSGEWLMEVKNEAEALEVVNYRKRRRERQSAIQKKQGDASEVEAEEEEKDVVHIPLVLKADVDGSIQVGVGTVSNGAGADAGDQHSQPLHSQRAVPRGGVGYGSGESGRHRDGARLQGHPCDLQHQNTELLRDLCLTRRSSPEGREVDARIHRLRHHHLLAVRHGACWVGE